MEILTTQALWENYNPAEEPLEANVFKTVEKDGLVTKQLYFTGRTVDNDVKTRVYAVVCHKNTHSVKQGVLLIGNYRQPINLGDLEELAKQGFVAMAIDFAGRNPKGMHTVYTDALDYCNADVAPSMFEITDTARETKLYEYALNCRRAVTYMLQSEKIKGVSVVTIGAGVYVGVIVMGKDRRLTNGAVLFGNFTRDFPENDKDDVVDADDAESLMRHLEYDKARQTWIMGLAPQTYSLEIAIPLYVINSANSPNVDVEQLNKMASRLNADCRYLVLPNSYNYITDKYFEGLVKWLKGARVPSPLPLIPATDANGDYCLKVKTSSSIAKTSVWYCANADCKAKYWRTARLSREGDYYVAKLDLYDKQNEILAFALFDREVATSTPLLRESVTVSRVKVPNKNIFSGNANQTLLRMDKTDRSLNVRLEQQLVEGYLGIVGAVGKALATFAISDKSICNNAALTLGFDVCCSIRQSLTVTAVKNYGEEYETLSQTIPLIGDGKWQRITVERENFRRTDDGKQISEEDVIDLIIVSAEQDIIVNNVFIV